MNSDHTACSEGMQCRKHLHHALTIASWSHLNGDVLVEATSTLVTSYIGRLTVGLAEPRPPPIDEAAPTDANSASDWHPTGLQRQRHRQLRRAAVRMSHVCRTTATMPSLGGCWWGWKVPSSLVGRAAKTHQRHCVAMKHPSAGTRDSLWNLSARSAMAEVLPNKPDVWHVPSSSSILQRARSVDNSCLLQRDIRSSVADDVVIMQVLPPPGGDRGDSRILPVTDGHVGFSGTRRHNGVPSRPLPYLGLLKARILSLKVHANTSITALRHLLPPSQKEIQTSGFHTP